MTLIRIFLVDDHPVLRTGLRALLTGQPDLVVVGEAGDGHELLVQLPTTPTDVVLLDQNMPGMDGAETARQLREHFPAVRVLALSMLAQAEHVWQMLDAGAAGYLLKSVGLDEIIHGIRTVAAGRTFLCSEVGLAALHRLCAAPGPPLADPTPPAEKKAIDLSRREIEVLQLIATGLTNQEIADRLFTSRRTVETHRQNIIEKTQMKNTASLIRFAVSEGMVA